MDLVVYFRVFSFTFNTYLRRKLGNKSSMDLVIYFLEPLMDIECGTKTISPLWISGSFSFNFLGYKQKVFYGSRGLFL
jgi:hypothetical protein